MITQEGNAAAKIKAELPILAVIGNPPYSGHSANRSWEIKRGKKELTFIGRLVQDYYTVDGRPLGEKNPKWLQDDYVKFIRWGQWRIERTGAGILAFVTNHGYLDNPTFRGMRQSLMNAFTDIYLLNLHGNSKKKEKCPDGSPDKNVFDIQQGVTLGIFVKERGTGVPPVNGPEAHKETHGQDAHATFQDHGQDAHATAARVFHADLWGLRDSKYKYLSETDIETTPWSELSPRSPDYLFIPQENVLRAEYDAGWKITDAMPVNNTGLVSKRDSLAFQHDKGSVLEVIQDIYNLSTAEIVAKYPLSSWSSRDGKPDFVKKSVMEFGVDKSRLVQALYRPFDVRWTYYTPKSKGFVAWPVYDVMRHILTKENVCVIAPRRVETTGAWCHIFLSRLIVDHVAVSLKTIDSTFPLYLYPTEPEFAGMAGRRPNLSPEFIVDIEERLGLKFAPEGRGTGVPPVNGPEAHKETHGQDAHATFHIRQGAYLPHWTRDGAIYAVCFRLADSLPESAIEVWRFEREDIIKTARQMNRPLTAHEEQLLDQLFSDRVEKFLDECRGECWMRSDEVASVVAGALKHFDGRRYQLIAWCVMPNHVHVIVRPFAGIELSQILHSWKSFSSKEANRLISRNGPFWQPEYYDHLIRDENDFARQVEYVLVNPLRAGLKEWKWVGCGTGVPPVNGPEAHSIKETHGQDARATFQTHGQDAHATFQTHGQDAHATIFGPEDVFNYIYAIFHSPAYRSRYAEFLKSDFPRIPLTSNLEQFRALCGLGAQLVALHLLESPVLKKPIARYPIKGSNLVDKGFPKYAAPGEAEPGTGKPLKKGRVYINRGTGVPSVNGPEAHMIKEAHGQDARATSHAMGQYFEGVPPEVWDFHIGGYQVCEKWLKDRRGRALTYQDLEHYMQIVTALWETLRLMAEIDAAIPKWPMD